MGYNFFVRTNPGIKRPSLDKSCGILNVFNWVQPSFPNWKGKEENLCPCWACNPPAGFIIMQWKNKKRIKVFFLFNNLNEAWKARMEMVHRLEINIPKQLFTLQSECPAYFFLTLFNLLSENITAFKIILKDRPFPPELLSYSIPSYSIHSISNCKQRYSLVQRNLHSECSLLEKVVKQFGIKDWGEI